MSGKPELIAPAGNMDCARAAVANGADAVYFGMQQFNARMRADNFTPEQLQEFVQFLHDNKRKAYCTFNTLIFTEELAAAQDQLVMLDSNGVDAVMVQDLGLAVLARDLGLRMDIHGSTQMTITSPEGVAFAAQLGIKRVVLARETSLRELGMFANGAVPVELEIFVHGALCIAYSGQCLTSEALGQRSANRGECAQACRLPYELIADGVRQELGDRRYLLSPRDLAAVAEIPELIRLGVTGFKIEGRLKTPEYVAATCQVYRKAIDAALASQASPVTDDDRYRLEMVFSRGFHTGWLHGVNHQQLVHGRYGKKRGPFVGFITRVSYDHVEVDLRAPLQPGDGLVFDSGGDTDNEEGGRLWELRGPCLYFERGRINFARLREGDRVWKTSDPHLSRALRKTFAGTVPCHRATIDLVVTGAAGQPLTVEACGCRVHSAMPLQTAYKRPLTTKLLRDQLGRLGETEFVLGEVHNKLAGQVILPVSELNRLRRALVAQIEANPAATRSGNDIPLTTRPVARSRQERRTREPQSGSTQQPPQLIALCRTAEHISAALAVGVHALYLDFEDLRRYADAVASIRAQDSKSKVFLATPRIQKAGEQGFFALIEKAKPDGVLIRNLGGIEYFRGSPLQKTGDYSINVANPVAAELLNGAGLDRLTVSYDLNGQQVLDLLAEAPPAWFELTIHQHLPMFHMEHCVFAAFLTTGTDHTNCGRPCDTVNLKVRDRVGMEHPVKADVGCRNTVFHERAQSGAEFLRSFLAAGARIFRVELLDEDEDRAKLILSSYRELLDGTISEPTVVTQRLSAVRQLGITSGTLTVLG